MFFPIAIPAYHRSPPINWDNEIYPILLSLRNIVVASEILFSLEKLI